MKTTRPILSLLAASALAACSAVEPRPMAPAMAAGDMLTGGNGMTLYTFDKDAAGSGKSACNGPCAANWPPFQAMDGARAGGDYSVVTRDDGKAQWAYKGKPLYYWGKDAKAGDTSGDGFNNLWRVARP